jgi:hypothetical protein
LFTHKQHVAAAGGRDRLVAVVGGHARDVGDLLYLQLTTSPADAGSAEAEARRSALADLLAPFTVPPR